MTTQKNTEVLYNAACPVCSKEIDHYAALTEQEVLPIGYDDLNDPEKLARWGLSPEAAARRLHVRKDGEILSGVPAFIALWREIPRYRWLARVVSFPGIYQLASAVYDYVLAPLLYRWHLRREARQA
jgi:predicted DCC family thiol-disulfide oxidoreductase YuxK